MSKATWYPDKGVKLLADSPALKKLRADMIAAREKKEREAAERIEKLRAIHSMAPLDLASKLWPSARRRLQERDDG